MISQEDLQRIYQLRGELFSHIRLSLAEDGHHKSYEGAFSISLPCYFDDEYRLSLDCYVVGPHRHYSWKGDTLSEAISKAEDEVRWWLKEDVDHFVQEKDIRD